MGRRSHVGSPRFANLSTSAPEAEIQPKLGLDAPTNPGGQEGPHRDLLVLVLLGAALLDAALFIDRGWIPHDDGMLGQAAVRVLTGELPHRDFHDVYSGALSYWHALSFVFFGIHLLSPRVLLLVCFAGFIAVAYGVARRFASPRLAAGVVLLSSVWSLPNYPAAMPTWYNLFLAVCGLWCLFRYIESGRSRWLLTAGVACGISVVFKIVGLYTVAAVLMILALIESSNAEAPDREAGESPDGRGYPWVLAAGVSVYVILVAWLVRANPDAVTLVHFVVPSLAVAWLTAWWVRHSGGSPGIGLRLIRLARLIAIFAAGAVIPGALFVAPYVVSGAVEDLVLGTLVLPFRRLSFERPRRCRSSYSSRPWYLWRSWSGPASAGESRGR